jgi:hypothetical protein
MFTRGKRIGGDDEGMSKIVAARGPQEKPGRGRTLRPAFEKVVGERVKYYPIAKAENDTGTGADLPARISAYTRAEPMA